MCEEPVAGHLARAPSAAAAAMAMNQLQDTDTGLVPRLLPQLQELGFNRVRGTGRVTHVDGEEWSAHRITRRSRSELLTTLTELKAMAAAATMGLSSPKAASGMPTTL